MTKLRIKVTDYLYYCLSPPIREISTKEYKFLRGRNMVTCKGRHIVDVQNNFCGRKLYWFRRPFQKQYGKNLYYCKIILLGGKSVGFKTTILIS